jgi:hypothetical protein
MVVLLMASRRLTGVPGLSSSLTRDPTETSAEFAL